MRNAATSLLRDTICMSERASLTCCDSCVPHTEMQSANQNHQVRDLGHCGPGTLRLAGAHVLP